MRLIVLIFGLTNHVSSQNLQPLRETGKISNCGKIRDHIASANFEQMHDILRVLSPSLIYARNRVRPWVLQCRIYLIF